MCGIAGMIDPAAPMTPEICEKMLSTMGRRGPDQKGQYQNGPATLLHARLSVMDLEHGRQPLCLSTPEEDLTLVYNGELYNTPELRRDLTQLGHHFEGHCDTEVLLHAYAQWGADCVPRLNGIFAFAVWEVHNRRLFVARDRIGVKPFFYHHQEGHFAFASELKTLLAHPHIAPKVDQTGILELMLVGPGRTPGCGVFQGIEELKPATCGYYQEGQLTLHSYWALTDAPHTDSFDETLYKVRTLVVDAIERQLVSDVPVCTFLSGGLDSSIISAVADRHFTAQGKTLHTFSVNYQDNSKYFTPSKFQPNSDESYIQMMNDALHAQHHNIILDSQDVAQALCEAVEARDLPGMADVDSSLLLFCRAVKEHATVALSGECADEIFGGYPWYRDPTIRALDGFPWAQSTAYRANFLQPDWLKGIDPLDYTHQKYSGTIAQASLLPHQDALEVRMKEMVNLNFTWFMQTLLDRKDRMSMWSGLEVRVPFCDYRIAQYLYTVPWSMKDYQGREKGLLRKAVEGLLPQAVLERKKSPYPKTHHPAYLATVSAMLEEILLQPDAPLLALIRPQAIRDLLDPNQSGLAAPWYGQLMTRPQTIAYLVQLNHWLKHYRVELV